MAPLSGLVVNDRDLADFGWMTETASGITGVVAMRTPTVQLAGSLGVLPTTPDPETGARALVFSGYVEAATNATLRAQLQSLLDYVSHGALEVRTAHDTGRFYVARFAGTTLPINDPTFSSAATMARGTIAFDVTTPFQVERAPRTYPILTTGTSGRVYIPLGTGPTRPLIQIRGAATNPKLTLYDAFGVKVGEMNFTISLGADDFLGIDCLTRRVSKSVAGTITAADSTRKLGDDFFNLLPRLGSQDAGRYVLLELSSGRAIVRARRSWKL